MSLHKDVERVLALDLGPSAPAFLKRQCESHLKIPVTSLTKEDLDELARWCAISVKIVLGEAIAENVKTGILKLK